MTRYQWLILILALGIFIIWRFLGAFLMLRLLSKTAKTRKTRFGCFFLCLLFGLPAYLYVAFLPDWQVLFYLRKIWMVINCDSPQEKPHVNSNLKFSTWKPETPKKDGQAQAHLILTGKTIEPFSCQRLIIVSEVPTNSCSLCNRTKRTFKLCRIIRNDTHTDTPLCTDCINAFVEYNPSSVFDLDTLEP